MDIEIVTEIFIRINSKGVVLSQADFAMSKIAADTENSGNELRKTIDYFCHLAIAPEFYKHIEDNDKEFANTDYFSKMRWLKTETEDLYDPEYTDLIRVAFTSQFNRGRLSDLVSLYQDEILKLERLNPRLLNSPSIHLNRELTALLTKRILSDS